MASTNTIIDLINNTSNDKEKNRNIFQGVRTVQVSNKQTLNEQPSSVQMSNGQPLVTQTSNEQTSNREKSATSKESAHVASTAIVSILGGRLDNVYYKKYLKYKTKYINLKQQKN